MNNLLNYFIEANLYLICFYLLYQLLLAKDKHFRFNRAFLLGGIFLSITLPLVTFNLSPVTDSPASFEGYIMLPAITITSVQTESVGFILKWWQVIGAIYFAGVLFYSIRLIWQMAHIMRHLPLLNSSRERKDCYTLVTTNGEIPTCSFFKFLFWDKSVKLDQEEKRQILEHELAHIKQWHSLDVLLIEMLRALFWFNPVIHLIKSRITEVHEFLADHYATKEIGVDLYSKLLTLQIFKSFDFALSNNFHKSQVLKRIRMLKSSKSKSLWLNIAFLIPALSLLILVLSCDVTELEEISPSSDLITEIGLESEVIRSQDKKDIEKPESKLIFTVVENQPAPNGGMDNFYEYVQSNLKYPTEAKQLGIEGKVFVQFVVDSEGNLVDVQSVKGIGGGCNEEAIRVIKESLPWNPGSQRGQKVNVRMIIPITFKLG